MGIVNIYKKKSLCGSISSVTLLERERERERERKGERARKIAIAALFVSTE